MSDNEPSLSTLVRTMKEITDPWKCFAVFKSFERPLHVPQQLTTLTRALAGVVPIVRLKLPIDR